MAIRATMPFGTRRSSSLPITAAGSGRTCRITAERETTTGVLGEGWPAIQNDHRVDWVRVIRLSSPMHSRIGCSCALAAHLTRKLGELGFDVTLTQRAAA